MKGVLGILLILVGLEVCYLVLAGKLPLQLNKSGSTATTSTTPTTDARQTTTLSVPSTTSVPGSPVPLWSGLAV